MRRVLSVIACLIMATAANAASAKNLFCDEFDSRWLDYKQLSAADLYQVAKHAECISKYVYVDADPSVIRRGVRTQSVIDEFDAHISLLVRTLEPYADTNIAIDPVALDKVRLEAMRAESLVKYMPYIYFEMLHSLTALKLGSTAQFRDSGQMRRAARRSYSMVWQLQDQAEFAAEYVLRDDYPHINWQSMSRDGTIFLRGYLQAYGDFYETAWYKCVPATFRGEERECGWDYNVPEPYYIRTEGRVLTEVLGGPTDGYEYGTSNVRKMRREVSDRVMDFRRRVSNRIKEYALTEELDRIKLTLRRLRQTG